MPLTAAVLAPWFICHDEAATVRHAWASPGAYPISRPRNLSSFVLHQSSAGGLVVHPSAIEAATSAMEVVAVAARNAALLVSQQMSRSAHHPPPESPVDVKVPHKEEI